MAATYTLISSSTLGSDTSNVTFSSIPSTYTDLVLLCSVRSTRTAARDEMAIEINSNTGANYGYRSLTGDGASATTTSRTADTFGSGGWADTDSQTANTFSNHEIYIPSYTIAQNHPVLTFSGQEANTATVYVFLGADLWRIASSISSIKIRPETGPNWKTGSSFYLYGIKNS